MKRDDLPPCEGGALAWRLDPGPTASVETWSEIPLSLALTSSTDPAPHLVFLASGAATPYEVQREAETWVLADCTAPLRLDLLFRSDRVIWTAQRALVLGAPDRLPEVKAAVQLFTRLESELRAIEHTAREGLRSAESDVTLTHAVKTSDLAQQARVGIMTQLAHLNRIRLTRLEMMLAQPSEGLPGSSRRMLSEMTQQAEFADRLRAVDDQIEVAQDIYDTVNDRLTEFSHFLREYRVEILIVVMLALEAGLVLWDMFGYTFGT